MKKKTFYHALQAFLITIVCLMLGVTWTAEASGADVPSWWAGSSADYDELVGNANKEGKLVWYDSLRDTQARDLAKAFNKLYPEIEIDHTRVRGTESRETIIRELQAGVTKIDVLEVSDELIPTYEKFNMFKSYPWKTKFKIHPYQLGKGMNMVKIGGNLFGFVVNTDKVSPQDIPRTYEDLLDPKWKGRKIGMDTRPKCFAAMWPDWGEEKMTTYLNKIAKQQILFKHGTTAGVQMTAAGEVHVYVAAPYDSYSGVKEKGAPIEYVIPLPKTGVSFEQEGVVNNAPHPHAAILFMGWLATGGQETYDVVSGGEGLPLPGFNTITGRMIKSDDQLAVFTDDWLPMKSEIRRKCNQALGFIEKKKKK